MECPNGHNKLEKVLFHDVEVDYCPECLGMWFDKDELTLAKNDKDEQLKWLDVDLWRDKHKFHMSRIDRRCPACRIPLVQVHYDDSSVRVDFCKHCKGIWLDRGEFKQIMVYLKRRYDYEILHTYTKTLAKELWEVFAGPEKLRDEISDVFMLLKLFNYKFVAQHPFLEESIEKLPK